MEEEKKKAKEVEIKTKSPMWVVVLVAVLVIALVCEFVYIRRLKISNQEQTQTQAEQNEENAIKVENIEDTTEKEETTTTKTTSNLKIYTCKELKGFYESTEKSKDRIYLNEDGTYNYEEDQDAAYGYFGNYIIDGNEIILNQLFSHGSDIGVQVNEKQIKGKINEDGSITLNSKNKMKFNKKSSSIEGAYDTLSKSVKNYIEYLEKLEKEAYK